MTDLLKGGGDYAGAEDGRKLCCGTRYPRSISGREADVNW